MGGVPRWDIQRARMRPTAAVGGVELGAIDADGRGAVVVDRFTIVKS
eukprot:SAG22_NODE_2804_length_2198_cov_1.545498_3_plen_47_part_00